MRRSPRFAVTEAQTLARATVAWPRILEHIRYPAAMARRREYATGSEDPPEEEEQEGSHLTQGRGRSKRTREADAVHGMAVKLSELPVHEFDAIALSADVREALLLARRLGAKKKERVGLRRQLLYVASLLRHEEPEDLRELQDVLGRTPRNSPRELALQRVELWRTRIMKTGDPVIEELMLAHPDADRQRLRQLARAAKKPFDPTKAKEAARAKKATRELFAALREVVGV